MSLPLSKNWSSLLLPFVAGAIIAALAFSLFGGASDQSVSSDLQGDVRKGTPEINTNAPGLSCAKTNCDLMAKLNQMHGNGGNSTWNLQSLASLTIDQTHGIRGVDSSGNVSSWTLGGLALNTDFRYTQLLSQLGSIRGFDQSGYLSTWSLESLAPRMYDAATYSAIYAANLVKNNATGPSSWTLQSLAAQIANVCQN